MFAPVCDAVLIAPGRIAVSRLMLIIIVSLSLGYCAPVMIGETGIVFLVPVCLCLSVLMSVGNMKTVFRNRCYFVICVTVNLRRD